MARGTLFNQLRSICPTISVGVLTADWMHLESQLELITKAGVGLLHFDVMDGCFCPMMTMGPPIIKAVKTGLLKDVHLMVDAPLEKLDGFLEAGADILTLNVESCLHLHRALQILGERKNANDPARGIIRGISLNPGTPLEVIEPVLSEIDLVLLLAVNPGWQGQRLIVEVQRRVERLKKMIGESKRDILICIDGGVRKDNVANMAQMGADILVTGSAVFDGKAPFENARSMIDALGTASPKS